MFFKKHSWTTVKKILTNYALDKKNIPRCYLRHSAAFGPQNLFLSDFDVTFFVDANTIDELRQARRLIFQDLKKKEILYRLLQRPIILPATNNAYTVCQKYYPHRSIYPMETWLSVDQELPMIAPLDSKYSLPLDHTPEGFLSCYMIPVLMGQRRRHIFENALITRNLKKDSLYTKVGYPGRSKTVFYGSLLADMDIWKQFYKNFKFYESLQKIDFNQDEPIYYPIFFERWKTARQDLSDLGGIASLWIYPSSHDDACPNIALNLKPMITAHVSEKVILSVLKVFHGLRYSLLVGREESMLGRINGLSRVSLLEPWLFKYYGYCFSGDPEIKRMIVEPSMDILKQKYQEFLLYVLCGLIWGRYPYAVYRLCFTLDHLFKEKELILNSKKLFEIYGQEFILEEKFDHRKDTPRFLQSLKEKHGFDLFGEK